MAKPKWSRCYLLPLLLLLGTAILCTAFMGLRNAAGNSALYIEDIRGDRSVLDDVVVCGVLQDAYHGMEFEIRNGNVKKHTRFYENNGDRFQPEYRSSNQLQEGSTIREDEISYSYQRDYVIPPEAKTEVSLQKVRDEDGYETVEKTTSSDRADIYINMNKNIGKHHGKASYWKAIRFHTGVRVQSGKQEFQITENCRYNDSGQLTTVSSGEKEIPESFRGAGNDNSHAFVRMDGSIYFTVLSTPNHSGTGGIYKIEEYADIWERMGGEERSQCGKVKTIVTFPLDGRDMTILGLKAVNGRLVLIAVENNILVLQAYDPESGNLLDEREVTPFDPSEYGSHFECFVEGSKMHLHIPKYRRTGSGSGQSQVSSHLLISVAVDDAFTLLHLVDDLDLEKGETAPAYVHRMDEANGKLFVFSTVSRKEEQQDLPYDDWQPKHFLLFVYQNGKLLYKGELMNDSDEDNIADRLRLASPYSEQGYVPSEKRQFRAVTVRGEEEK